MSFAPSCQCVEHVIFSFGGAVGFSASYLGKTESQGHGTCEGTRGARPSRTQQARRLRPSEGLLTGLYHCELGLPEAQGISLSKSIQSPAEDGLDRDITEWAGQAALGTRKNTTSLEFTSNHGHVYLCAALLNGNDSLYLIQLQPNSTNN